MSTTPKKTVVLKPGQINRLEKEELASFSTIDYLLDELQLHIFTKKKEALFQFERFYFDRYPTFTDREIFLLFCGDQSRKGLLFVCGQSSWKTAGLKRSSMEAVQLVAKLLSAHTNTAHTQFVRVLSTLVPVDAIRSMRLEKHINNKVGARQEAFAVLQVLSENRSEPVDTLCDDSEIKQKLDAFKNGILVCLPAGGSEEESTTKSSTAFQALLRGPKMLAAKLDSKLRRRPTREEVIDRNILEEASKGQAKKEQKTGFKDTLTKFFKRRPSKQELVAQKIMKEPLVFGVSLETFAVRGYDIPPVMAKCIAYIEDRALDVEGIFRLPGNNLEITALKQRFDEGEDVNVFEVAEVHNITSLLKLFLRDLPIPLFTFELYPDFITAQQKRDDAEREQAVITTLQRLPRAHKVVLNYLVLFLAKASTHSNATKMTHLNLALVFAPNLLRPQVETYAQIVNDSPHVQALLASLILNYELYLSALDL
eukprot:GILJ01002010.1.p1 GENE.GILJ01002010.1~~GILJ01002010.1.p1  ORF type:complete len:482 (-),score=100.20 GILJ01002010.1:399-1844(-)